MSLLILDKDEEREIRARRKALGIDQHDEVWEGVYVMSPAADIEHQDVAKVITTAFYLGIDLAGLGKSCPTANVSDRVEGWKKNYRTPDAIVVLSGSVAESHGTFWTGPLDFVIEIVSPGDRSRKKLSFYSKIGVHELLIIDRKPWRLTLYRHDGESLRPAGTCDGADGAPLVSEVIPFSLRLVANPERPKIELRHTTDDRTWLA